jgi:GxxExxY protein
MNVYDFHERQEVKADAETEELARLTIGAAIEVHAHPGPGLPEIAYRKALSHELTLRNIPHECEFPVPIIYKGEVVGKGFIDILVGGRLVVEIKVAEVLTKVHRGQSLSYLQALKLQLALLLNYNVAIMRDGIKREINTYPD